MDVGALVTTALADIPDALGAVAVPALAIGASIVALTVGWKFAKKFVRG